MPKFRIGAGEELLECLETEAEEIVVPDNVRKIGGRAFSACGKLKRVVIGRNVRSVAKNAFEGCRPLEIKSRSDAIKARGGFLLQEKWGEQELICVYADDVAIPSDWVGIGAGFSNLRKTMRSLLLHADFAEIADGALDGLRLCKIKSESPAFIADNGVLLEAKTGRIVAHYEEE